MRVIGAEDFAPAVSVEQFKGAVHIAAEDLQDDDTLELMLAAADDAVTTATAHPLTERDVEFIVTLGEWRRWWFPVRPVQALIGLAVDDGNGGWTDQPLAGAQLQFAYDEPQLLLSDDWAGLIVDGDLLRVQARVGEAGGKGPRQIKPAIIQLAREWYEAGISIDAESVPGMTFGVHRLIRQARYKRPKVSE